MLYGAARSTATSSGPAVAAFVPGGLAAMRASGGTTPEPTPRYYALNIALSFLAAVGGGWLTMRLAPRAPATHVDALCALILVMALASALSRASGRQPSWYKLVIPLVGIAGAAASLVAAGAAI